MWELLPTDYEDIKYKGKKKYDIIKNDDGTVLIRDLTDYINLEKTFFGAEQANKMNEALNKIMDALAVNWTPVNLSDRLDDNEKLFLELNSMWLHNNFTACLIIEDDKDDFIILQDDERNAILADWRYKEL